MSGFKELMSFKIGGFTNPSSTRPTNPFDIKIYNQNGAMI